jgi:hypothetical protein
LSLNLAEVYAGQGDYTHALAAVDDYITTRPVSTEAYELKVRVLGKLNRGGDVVSSLQGHLRDDPENTALRLLLAKQTARAGMASEAEAIYLGMLEKSVSADIYHGLLALYREQGDRRATTAETSRRQHHGGAGEKDRPGDATATAAGAAVLTVLREDGGCVKVMLPEVRRRLQTGTKMHGETRRLVAVLAAGRQLDGRSAVPQSAGEPQRPVRAAKRVRGLWRFCCRCCAARKYGPSSRCAGRAWRDADTNHHVLPRHGGMALMALGKTEEA